ncbi:tRNA 2-thiouridine(34) synthase MnmA [Seleniivibrio sp.]|uniref:tRNA 2-thiouridine(34) synthase MnmA n=1 Tax=Seleniivibrio sp. TaxID=2898801 RepID=UPI0025CFA3B6|nr:tRNA 2-thiouridine(34) synthase MnmA [Seleniivibrio sp.]MCD8552691.1 tRNA 2-thiouridine(34) synthase MnmA [Seleniivibrio sp.]
MQNKRVIAAMSGGVDSSAAAAMLVEQGYDVIGVTMKLRECSETEESPSCCGVDGILKASAACAKLGIRHYVYDCIKDFEEMILKPAWEEYSNGRTPSPCLNCNEKVKFGLLMKFADELGADYIATGHYSRTVTDENGVTCLMRGQDKNKDQSYFLAGLTREQLKRVLFPLGEMVKPQVREYARTHDIPSAETPDSQDACLVGAFGSFSEMLRHRFSGVALKGDVVDEQGVKIAPHEGIHRFTVGQRRGLNLNTHKTYWVKNISGNTVTVTDNSENVFGNFLIADNMSTVYEYAEGETVRCQVQVRYRQKPVSGTYTCLGGGKGSVVFDEPVSAIAPGQAVVLFDGEKVLGRGRIISS